MLVVVNWLGGGQDTDQSLVGIIEYMDDEGC